MIDLGRRDGRMLRIGHRGAAALAPENTIESLRLALELGCDLVEFDVHDLEGTLVLVHDRPSEPAPELPTLDETLAFLAGTTAGAYLDLKARGAEAAGPDLPRGSPRALAALPLRVSRLVARAGASTAVLHFAVATKGVVERCHALGAPVLVWTVDERPCLSRLEAMGVDGVITNDPRIFSGLDSPAR